MKQNADEMMHRGLLAEELAIQHMRKPGDGMPITRVTGCECPLNILPIQTALNVRIGGDVIRIVVIDEIVLQRRRVDRESHKGKQKAEQRRRPQPLGPRSPIGRQGFRCAMWFVVFCHQPLSGEQYALKAQGVKTLK